MEISSQLVKPFVEKMEMEWQKLYTEVSGYDSGEAVAMRPSIQQRIRQLEKWRMSATYCDQNKSGFDEFPNLREALRFLKLDLRMSRRKWRRHLVLKIRNQKRLERSVYGECLTA
ncbi:MAG: hypothetical protein KTQ49_05670 [Candidatus Omnitrophica bacterium]|nr:hypothetical protein [Candidatus Omnitrophota bacterium]